MRGKYTVFKLLGPAILLALPLSAHAAPPRCFLHGLIVPVGENTEKMSLTNMIRMHFDADEQKKCERMLKAYCVYNVKGKQYSPTKLEGSFKEDAAKDDETKYTFAADCKLQSSDSD